MGEWSLPKEGRARSGAREAGVLELTAPHVWVAVSLLRVPSRAPCGAPASEPPGAPSGVPGQGGPGPVPRVLSALEPSVGGRGEVSRLDELVIFPAASCQGPWREGGAGGVCPGSQTSFLQQGGQLGCAGVEAALAWALSL